MAETKYTYSIASDFPGGAVNEDKMTTEIAASSIVTVLDRIDTTGDVIDVVFKAALSAGDKTVLDNDATGPSGGLIAAHDNTANADPAETTITDKIGGFTTIIDGVSSLLAINQWHRMDLTLAESLHLQGVRLNFENMEVGDHAWLALIHPGADSSPQSAVSVNDTTVTVGTGLGAYYNPAGGAVGMEFWDDSDVNLVEVAGIDSVSGDVVTLKTGVKNAHSTSAKVRSCFKHHTQMRGTNKTSGGLFMIGNGHHEIESVNGITNLATAGLILGARIEIMNTGNPREMSINYKLRRP